MFFHQKSLFSLFCSAMTLRVASFHFFQNCHCCSQSESERNTKNIYIYISWLITINIKWIHILYLQKMFHKTNKIRHLNHLIINPQYPQTNFPSLGKQPFQLDPRLHSKFGSHGVPNANLSNFAFLLVDFGKVLCSSTKELQQNSNAASREEFHN